MTGNVLISKPYWCHHAERVINAIHVHPEGGRIATCGGDNSIRIWAYPPLVDANVELDVSKAKILAQLDNHTNVVNCVRWSPDGEYLASCSVDNSVMVWYMASGQEQAFDKKVKNIENWKCLCILTGHTADVQDISWHPQSLYVASCSVDNSVIIWRRKHDRFEQHKTLRGHTDFVKGVSWDPKGKYLCSQSADGTMVMWRASDWERERVFKEEFRPQNQMLLKFQNLINRQVVFSRPSWSPNGDFVIAAGGVSKNDVFISPVYKRGSWSHEVSFVGHTKSTTVARWNPKMFVKEGGEVENVKGHYSVCAIGGLDCTVTVWTTSSNRALLVVEEVFREAVLDLTWSPNGLTLFAASHDGSILVVTFDEESLGVVVPDKLNACSTGDDELIENALIMKMLEKQKQKEEETGQDVQEEEVEVDEGPSEAVELPPQTEVVVNGRRRIIPVRIPSPVKRVKRRIQPKSFPIKKPLPGLDLANGKIAKKGNIEKKAEPGGSPLVLGTKAKLLDRMGGSGAQSGFDKTKLLDRMGGSGAQSTFDKAPKPQSPIVQKPNTIVVLPSKKKDAIKSQEKNLKRVIPSISSPAPPPKKRKIINLDGPLEEKSVRYLPKPAVMLKDPKSFSSRKFISAKLDPYPSRGGSDAETVTILEARILTRRRYSGENIYTALTCLKGDQIIWRGEVEGHASVIAGNRMFSAVGTMEGKLYLFSRAGSFLKLPINLSSEVVSLSLNRHNELLGITNDGKGYVWRINPSVGELSEFCFDFDVATLLKQNSKPGTTSAFAAWITDSTKVLISFKDKSVFIFDRAMRIWGTVSDGSYWGSKIRPGRIAQGQTNAASSGSQPDTLKGIQHKYAPERHPFDLANLSDRDAHIHTLLYLERQIAASQALDLRDEYASWTLQYISFLVDSVGDDESFLDRLRESCDKLLCAYAEESEDLKQNPEIEADKAEESIYITPSFKRGLLRKALPRLMANSSLRSLVSRLAKDLEQQEKSNSF